MVSLRHLLALKCHAIKHGHFGRIVKDTDDVIRLVQVNRVDVNVPEIRHLFLKHGTKNGMKKCDAPTPPAENAELELPDWRGMDDSSARMSSAVAFELCERHTSWFPDAPDHPQAERPPKCVIEFTL